MLIDGELSRLSTQMGHSAEHGISEIQIVVVPGSIIGSNMVVRDGYIESPTTSGK